MTASWGWYRRAPAAGDDARLVWKRSPVQRTVDVPLGEGPIGPLAASAEQPEVVLRGLVRRHGHDRIVSLFLVYGQEEPEKSRDEAWLFQPQLVVEGIDGRPVFC